MSERIVLLQMGDYAFSLPFDHVDEILGADRAMPRNSIPEEVETGGEDEGLWVSSRGRWLKVLEFLPEISRTRNSQILVISCGGSSRAFQVEQVVGIETVDPLRPFPEVAKPFCDLPFSGIRFLKDRLVLELDLSRLISLDSGGMGGD